MHGKSVGFALQKSRFRNAKMQLPLFNKIIFTKKNSFNQHSIEKNAIFAV
ncbi:hypothetical protein PI172_2145 [Prevotella intermedia]|uniref:Uncharacterized protein n=1 Tax=Prevotella intermedia TaxID=28131 RepID=A0AAD1F822_PREIN|nr:hypothetical protein PIN17_0056 [Prevotella intermedia 17]BAR96873.1 hypothetical protein PI172_2145 [Prevotella intermedia]